MQRNTYTRIKTKNKQNYRKSQRGSRVRISFAVFRCSSFTTATVAVGRSRLKRITGVEATTTTIIVILL